MDYSKCSLTELYNIEQRLNKEKLPKEHARVQVELARRGVRQYDKSNIEMSTYESRFSRFWLGFVFVFVGAMTGAGVGRASLLFWPLLYYRLTNPQFLINGIDQKQWVLICQFIDPIGSVAGAFLGGVLGYWLLKYLSREVDVREQGLSCPSQEKYKSGRSREHEA